jgi:hypothetical protein
MDFEILIALHQTGMHEFHIIYPDDSFAAPGEEVILARAEYDNLTHDELGSYG